MCAVCRAKLEEALERMDRVVLAMESDSVHASPYTADLAVQLTDNGAAESVSPALQQASIPSIWHAQAEYHLQCHVIGPSLNTNILQTRHTVPYIPS